MSRSTDRRVQEIRLSEPTAAASPSAWRELLVFSRASEIHSALLEAGVSAADLLQEPLSDAEGVARMGFEILWRRARVERSDDAPAWALVVEAMAVATDRVNRPLFGGRLPLVEMMEWGPAFGSAREAFANAGASCWKRDALGANAIGKARRSGEISAAWLQKAMREQDPLETDNAKADLKLFEAGAGFEKPVSAQEWARRFEWESRRRESSFDTECAWLLTRRFSPAEALSAWRRAVGDKHIAPSDLARWVLTCVWGKRPGLPSTEELRLVGGPGLAAQLARAALTTGPSDGAAKDGEGSELMVAALVEACDLCGADYRVAAKFFADQVSGWRFGEALAYNPAVSGSASEQLANAMGRAHAQWETRRLNAVVPSNEPAPAPRVRL